MAYFGGKKTMNASAPSFTTSDTSFAVRASSLSV